MKILARAALCCGLLAVSALATARTIIVPVDDLLLPVSKLSIVGTVTMTGAPATVALSISPGNSVSISSTGGYGFDFDHFGQAVNYRVTATNLTSSATTCTSTPAYRDVSLGPSADTTGVDFTINCVANPTAANDARFVSQTVPGTMNPGQTYGVSVTMRNAGTATWPSGSTYVLGSQNPASNTTWGAASYPLAASVPAGSNVTFSFNVTAPATVGYYNFQWQMLTGGTSFGDATANAQVKVGAPDAAFVSQVVPSTMVAGRTYPVAITMKNTGQTTWTAAQLYKLSSQSGPSNTTWGSSSVPMPGSVVPGGSVTFTFDVTAPAVAGNYNFQWQAFQASLGFFGQMSQNISVAVKDAASSTTKTYYVHDDHLGTPRTITQATDNQAVWRWDNTEPFGLNTSTESPSGLSLFVSNLRFPGQYYDAEAGKNSNYFRDYDPSVGRYLQSDPIGLWGGASTYGYVGGSPLKETDEQGLVAPAAAAAAPFVGACGPACWATVVVVGAVAVIVAKCSSDAPREAPPIPPDRIRRCREAWQRCMTDKTVPESKCFDHFNNCTSHNQPYIGFPGKGNESPIK